MNNQTYYSWKHKAVDPLSSIMRQQFIITFLGARGTTLQNLNTKVQINYEKNV
jgi:hypothetical protein